MAHRAFQPRSVAALAFFVLVAGSGLQCRNEPASRTWTYTLSPAPAGIEVTLRLPDEEAGERTLASLASTAEIARRSLRVVDGTGEIETRIASRTVAARDLRGRDVDRIHEDLVLPATRGAVTVTYVVDPLVGGIRSAAFHTAERGICLGKHLLLVPPDRSDVDLVVEAKGPGARWIEEVTATEGRWDRAERAVFLFGAFDGDAAGVILDRKLSPPRRKTIGAVLERLLPVVDEILPADARRAPVVVLDRVHGTELFALPPGASAVAVDLDTAPGAWRWELMLRSLLEPAFSRRSWTTADAWLGDALPGYLAARLLVDEGLLDEGWWIRAHRRSAALAPRDGPLFRLDRYRQAPPSVKTFLREIVSPLVLHEMDRELEAVGSNVFGLVRQCSDEEWESGRSWVDLVRETTGHDLGLLYHRLVAGNGELLPDVELSTPRPDPGGDPPPAERRRIELLVTEGVAGETRAGDALRIAAAGLLLDAGGLLPTDEPSRVESFVTSLAELPWQALAPSSSDLAAGPESLALGGLPWVCCNVVATDGSRPLIPALETEVNGLAVGIVGVSAPPESLLEGRERERRLDWVRFEDPVARCRAAAAELRDRCDLVVVLGTLSPAAVRDLATGSPRIDLVVSRDRFTGGIPVWDTEGFVGDLLVLHARSGSRGVRAGTLDVSVAKPGRIVGREWQLRTWDELE